MFDHRSLKRTLAIVSSLATLTGVGGTFALAAAGPPTAQAGGANPHAASFTAASDPEVGETAPGGTLDMPAASARSAHGDKPDTAAVNDKPAPGDPRDPALERTAEPGESATELSEGGDSEGSGDAGTGIDRRSPASDW